MTCIVGLEWNGKAYIGGDTQGTGPNSSFEHTQPKIFERGGVLFGYTTSYRFGQIIEHHLQDPLHVPANRENVYPWLCQNLVPKIQYTLRQNGWDGGGALLLAVHGELWKLQDDFSVLRSTNGFLAVGSGLEFALGSIRSSINNLGSYNHNNDPEEVPIGIVKQAIDDAGFFCPSVGRNAVVMSNG